MYSATMCKVTHSPYPKYPRTSIRNSDGGTRIGCGGIRWHGSQEKRKRVAGGEVSSRDQNKQGEQSSRGSRAAGSKEQGAAPS